MPDAMLNIPYRKMESEEPTNRSLNLSFFRFSDLRKRQAQPDLRVAGFCTKRICFSADESLGSIGRLCSTAHLKLYFISASASASASASLLMSANRVV